MELITDRTQMDVLLGNSKGQYGPEDLNRVEQAVATLAGRMKELGETCPALSVKTDWQLTALFSPEQWPVKKQMKRYLSNVKAVMEAYGMEPQLPDSMERLTWQKANQIEKQLALLERYIENQKAVRQFCGTAECGG